MSLVLDASITLAWVFGEAAAPGVRQVFETVAERGAVVPGLWWLEVANSLTVAVRRQRIDAAFRRAALDDLAALDITTDPEVVTRAWTGTLDLTDEHRLTIYDAVYLEVALRRGLPLATLDRDLRNAAARSKVPLAVA